MRGGDMSRAPDNRSQQAKEMYLSGKKLIEIAELLNVPEGTVRSWKNRYHWGNFNATLQKEKRKERNVAKKRERQKTKAVMKEVEAVIQNPDLTDKQQLFCISYVRCFNATKAYQKAYGCEYATAMVEGSKLLKKPKIKEQILSLKWERLNREFLSETDIFQKYMDIAFADFTDFAVFGKKEVKYIDKQGNEQTIEKSFVDLKESSEVDGTLISEISQGKNGVKIKLADRMKALQWLTDHMDLATEEQKARIALLKAKANLNNDDEESVEVNIYMPVKDGDDG